MINIRTDDVKRWLGRYAEVYRSLELLRERLDLAETAAYNTKSATPDGMPRSGGNPVDTLGRAVAKLEKLRAQVSATQAKADSIYEEIEEAIDKIAGARCAEKRTVLLMRYLDLMAWSDVNNALFGDREDFLTIEDSLMRRTFYIHGEALKKLGDILDAQRPAEAATRSDDREIKQSIRSPFPEPVGGRGGI